MWLVFLCLIAKAVAEDESHKTEHNSTNISLSPQFHGEEEAPSDKIVLIMTAVSLGILSVLGCLCYGLFKYQTVQPNRKARKYEYSVRNGSLHPKKTMLTLALKSTDSSSAGTSQNRNGHQESANGVPEAQNKSLADPSSVPSDGMVEIKIDER